MSGKNIYQTAIEVWGRDSQFDMAIEEMSELTKAILKLRRAERSNSRAKRDMINRETIEGNLEIKALEGGLLRAQEDLVGEWANLQILLSQIRFMVPGKYEYVLEDKMKVMITKLRSYDKEPGEDYEI